MAQSTPPLLTPEELEASRNDLGTAGAAVSRLPPGLVKRRMEAALKEVDSEIQAQLWGHLRSSSASGSGATSQRGASAPAATAAAVTPTEGGSRGEASAAAATAAAATEQTPMASDSPTGKVLGTAHRARVTPSSPLHAAALAVHCLLVAEGFVCTGQDDKAGAVKGFAAPVRDVSADKLVPDRWDADQSAVSFRYRRPDQPGKVYLFKTAGAPSSSSSSSSGVEGERCPPAQFFLGEKGGEIMSADVDLKPLERRSSPNLFESEDFYQELFSVFRREVLWPLVPTTRTSPTASAGAAGAPQPASGSGSDGAGGADAARAEAQRLRDEEERGRRTQPRPPAIPGTEEDDPLRVGPPRFAGPPGVGPAPFIPGRGGDCGGDLFPSGAGDPAGGGGGGGLPGPGGLLGPGHPMFGGGGGAGYMEPRFDPYGPPMPGQPWGPGVPGRGAGRGGPAQGGPRGPPGGPDNDHLRPPGGSGNMFF